LVGILFVWIKTSEVRRMRKFNSSVGACWCKLLRAKYREEGVSLKEGVEMVPFGGMSWCGFVIVLGSGKEVGLKSI